MMKVREDINPEFVERVEKLVEKFERECALDVFMVNSDSCILCDELASGDIYLYSAETFDKRNFLCLIHQDCHKQIQENEEKKELVFDRILCLHERGQTIRIGGVREVKKYGR